MGSTDHSASYDESECGEIHTELRSGSPVANSGLDRLDRQSEKLGTRTWHQVNRIEKQDVEVVEKFGGPCPLDHTERR